MKAVGLAIAATLGLAAGAQAEDGLYFGAGVTVISTTSAPDQPWGGYESSGHDTGLALTLGYRFASSGKLGFGLEGNLDLTTGKTMDDSCDAVGPAWCAVDNTLRLRGTVTFDLGNAGDLTTSLGAVMVKGTAEDGPGLFVDATGKGLSLGLAWQGKTGFPLRYDLNVDRIRSDDTPNYDRSLDVVSLRVSYMF